MFFFCLVFGMHLCASVYLCLVVWSPAGKGLTSGFRCIYVSLSLSFGILG